MIFTYFKSYAMMVTYAAVFGIAIGELSLIPAGYVPLHEKICFMPIPKRKGLIRSD